MKRTVLIAALFATLVSASAYTGYDGPDEGMHVMGSSDSPSPTSIERNGTDWRMTFEEVNSTAENTSTGISSHSFEGKSVRFQGIISTPTPCHKLNAEISEEGRDSYGMKISSNKTSNSTCEQVVTYRKYNASFEYERPFKITINYNNSEEETLTHPDFGRKGEPVDMPRIQPEQKGPIQKLIDWFKDLFSDDPKRISADKSEVETIDREDIIVEEG